MGGRRWWFALGVFAWVAATALALAIVLFLDSYRQGADYPDALLVAEHTIYRFNPHIAIRRDAALRSADEFNNIYNWYSVGFDLGPERYGQGECILMARSFTDWQIVERDMSVTLCNTPNGRMIFLMRSLTLRWP